MRTPDFFIVGAPKCGTTAMYCYLKQHPEIFFPEKKELHYFGSDLESPWFIRDKNIYLSMFLSAKNEKRIGEASVWYLYSKLAASEIKAFCPNASIIIMLRNPMDMLYSQHSQFLFNGNEDISDFETALNAEKDRKQGLQIPQKANFTAGLFYRETVKYSEDVHRYISIFGRENVHIIIFDDFNHDTAKSYKETLCFLKVNESFQPSFQVVNPNKHVRNRALNNVLQKPPSFPLVLSKMLIPRTIRRILRDKLQQLSVQYTPRPPMDLHVRKRLQAEFAPEVERLGKLLERDLSHWCGG